MGLPPYTPDEVRVFTLILIRISIILFLFPVYGSPMFPALAKAGLALLMTFILYPVVDVTPSHFPVTFVEAGVLMVSEFIIGMIIGLTIRFFFASVQMAGQVIGFQMGFSMINVVDPQSGDNVSIMEQIGYWVAILLFLQFNGHHFVITALVESFKVIKPGVFYLRPEFVKHFLILSKDIFIVGLKIGAPVIAALLCTSACFGICAKFVPQMNIMIVAFPLKIVIGLAMMGICLQMIVIAMKHYLSTYGTLLSSILKAMGSG